MKDKENNYEGFITNNDEPLGSYGIITFPNKTIYQGSVSINGAPSEVEDGSITYPDGRVYKGPVNPDGNPSGGFGSIITYPNGNIYCGEMDIHGNPTKGELTCIDTDSSKNVYKVDNVDNDNKQGKSSVMKLVKKLYGNGDIYEGNFKNSTPCGKGEITYNNGDKYTGDFDENGGGKPHGKGKLTYKEGDVIRYNGAFKNGLPEDEGELLYTDGTMCKVCYSGGLIIRHETKLQNV